MARTYNTEVVADGLLHMDQVAAKIAEMSSGIFEVFSGETDESHAAVKLSDSSNIMIGFTTDTDGEGNLCYISGILDTEQNSFEMTSALAMPEGYLSSDIENGKDVQLTFSNIDDAIFSIQFCVGVTNTDFRTIFGCSFMRGSINQREIIIGECRIGDTYIPIDEESIIATAWNENDDRAQYQAWIADMTSGTWTNLSFYPDGRNLGRPAKLFQPAASAYEALSRRMDVGIVVPINNYVIANYPYSQFTGRIGYRGHENETLYMCSPPSAIEPGVNYIVDGRSYKATTYGSLLFFK